MTPRAGPARNRENIFRDNQIVLEANYRVAVDNFGTVYLIGRARSNAESAAAHEGTLEAEGVKKVLNYVVLPR
ncbi:MAG: BON domain-containing protein [Alphaproteobacteria bacterium]|nr:BON domain-containing protein [Alphaproteobacteria bacterium]